MLTAILSDVNDELTAQRVLPHSYCTDGDLDLENWMMDFISLDF